MTSLLDWLATATPEQVVKRIEDAEARATLCERDAFLWHVAMTASAENAEALRESCNKVADLLIKGGYVWPPK